MKKTGGIGMIYEAIKKLVQYGLDTGLITEVDKIYATNHPHSCFNYGGQLF